MKIYHNPELISELKNSYLFLDNTALIAILNHEESFADFLEETKNVGCALHTIPSVVFEFLRTDSIEGFNKRTKFVNKYLNIYPIERHLKEFEELMPVLQRICGGVSYPDFLLYCCVYKFPSSFLMTENHKDFSTKILDRINILTLDGDKDQIRNTGIYKLSPEKYTKAAQAILKEPISK